MSTEELQRERERSVVPCYPESYSLIIVDHVEFGFGLAGPFFYSNSTSSYSDCFAPVSFTSSCFLNLIIQPQVTYKWELAFEVLEPVK